MAADEGFDDDDPEFLPPLPPEDRIWRHPAELAASGAFASATAAPARSAGRSPWTVGFVSVIGGVLLASSLMFGVGGVGDEPARIALQPIATLAPRDAAGDDGTETVALDAVPPSAALVGIDVDAGAEVRSGNGLVMSADGVVVTTASLVASATEIRVADDRGHAHTATVLGVDPLNDLAVLRVADLAGTPAVVDPAVHVLTGEAIRAFGASRGIAHPSWAAVVADNEARVSVGQTDIHGVLQLDQGLDASAAGSPVVRIDGTIVGLVTNVQSDGPSYVVTNRTIASVTAQIVATGQARHGWLGVEGVTAPEVGAQVRRVLDGSPAQQAGFSANDVVVSIDGEAIETIGDLVVAVRERQPGATATIGVDRGGVHVDLAVSLAEAPAP